MPIEDLDAKRCESVSGSSNPPADFQGGHDIDWIVYQRIGSVILRVLLVWAYLYCGRVALAAIAMHAMDNVSWVIFTSGGGFHEPLFITVVALIVGIVLIFFSRHHYGLEPRPVPGRDR